MNKKVSPIGKFVLKHVEEVRKEIEIELGNISVDGEEFAVTVDYSFSISPNRLVDDCFSVILIPYIDDKKQGTFKFKFKSLETIFLKEICELMYQVTVNPEKAEYFISESKVNIELV